jgi:hypothetical protein
MLRFFRRDHVPYAEDRQYAPGKAEAAGLYVSGLRLSLNEVYVPLVGLVVRVTTRVEESAG